MGHNTLEQTWWYLHLSNNELVQQSTNRLFKIQILLKDFKLFLNQIKKFLVQIPVHIVTKNCLREIRFGNTVLFTFVAVFLCFCNGLIYVFIYLYIKLLFSQ